MADLAMQVVVSPFLGVLFDNLSSLIQNELALLYGLEKEIKKLSDTLLTIRNVLEDAEEQQLTNKTITTWLIKLKDAAYEADDIVDEWATGAIRLASEIRTTCTNQVCDSLLSCFRFEQVQVRHKIAKSINELRQRFDEIASERVRFHLKEGGVERKLEYYKSRETSSILTEPQIYGRDKEKEYIVSVLLGNSDNQENLSICPILGIGGIGKTTVAQSVYNDERVAAYYEVRIWVSVSQDFDVKRLIRAVIVSISGACTIEDLDPLQRFLQEKLDGKLFLLVLDDVWNENQEEWNRFKYSLRCGAKGSSVIVTTRLKTVASITGTCPAYSLKTLSEDDCWSLFKQRAFGTGNEENLNLEKIGKEIVKKCGGVPLAAKVLGGLLRFSVEEKQWLFIRDNRIWDLPQSNENTILRALRLSYTHLNAHVRQCFAYCSIYPKGYNMRREEVIDLWIANDLFHCKEKLQLEDIGNEIFNALLWRSFFQDVKRDEDGNIETFMMHDLVHDLACSITMNECCNVVADGKIINVPEGSRHLSVSFKTTPSSSIFQFIHQSTPNLRTLISLIDMPTIDEWQGRQLPTHLNFSAFKSLRAMSLEDIRVTTLPDSIGNLRHLRYLKLSCDEITSLPESICRLRTLQTLKLMNCSKLQMLPREMRNMINLRHLDIKKCDRLREMPISMGKLTCLQTLSIFIAGPDSGRHIKELQELDNLGGELTVKGLQHVRSSNDAKEAMLMGKKNLRTLSLNWSYPQMEERNDKDVIEALQPHPNIKRLSIKGYQGLTLPIWLEFSTLPNLVEVFLDRCTRCEQLPSTSLARLPLLKTLQLHAMHSVKIFSIEYMVNGFQSLENLELDDLPDLEECSSAVGNQEHEQQLLQFPCLKKLIIRKCPKLKRLPLSSSVERLDVEFCNDMISGFRELVSFPEGMLTHLPALQSLSIWNCSNLKTLPAEVGDLSELTRLGIISCTNLVSLPSELRNLSSLQVFSIFRCNQLNNLLDVGRTSLTHLTIENCSDLTELAEGLRYLTTLQSLHISRCPKLTVSTVEFQNLISLRHLTIENLPELTSLPDGLQHHPTLLYLQISEFAALTSLPNWMVSLTELRCLSISNCKNMRCLPDGLQLLTNLQSLWINDCHPELHRRCEKGRGEDWHKIAHIPDFKI
ncbi:hypothetical protein AQUCO_01500404v1 [Aquilegia coerulea]|uniref:Uncharacterized protein n=1 Tax=Aquilegia coerulea TaxID=218851 RepID=A0A2G5DUA8_AQUCA|nr:hypothetical protein AQUCO_01500404v1 [Aquilegia coerulea]